MKNKLGFICSAKIHDTSRIPKDYFRDRFFTLEGESKYITFRDTFKFSEFFKENGYLPELVWENEIDGFISKSDVWCGVNVFLRKKFERCIR